jgi:hypothetical protein
MENESNVMGIFNYDWFQLSTFFSFSPRKESGISCLCARDFTTEKIYIFLATSMRFFARLLIMNASRIVVGPIKSHYGQKMRGSRYNFGQTFVVL